MKTLLNALWLMLSSRGVTLLELKCCTSFTFYVTLIWIKGISISRYIYKKLLNSLTMQDTYTAIKHLFLLGSALSSLTSLIRSSHLSCFKRSYTNWIWAMASWR